MPSYALRARALALLALLPFAPACATAGATYNSGVGDRFLQRPPYYAGNAPAAAPTLLLPIAFQAGATQSPIFEPTGGSDSPLGALLADMNAYLATLLPDEPRTSAGAGTPPDVMFDCAMDPTDDCEGEPDGYPDDQRRMRLAVGRPSGQWIAWLGPELQRAGAARALVATLEVAQYFPRQTNLRGDKVVDLGTGHAISLPWLTSLEQPVQVLQITGALVGPDGKALRIGAEGMLAKRTGILLSGVGAQALISDEDVRALRDARRHDLPGEPLVWRAALSELIAGLTGLRPTADGR